MNVAAVAVMYAAIIVALVAAVMMLVNAVGIARSGGIGLLADGMRWFGTAGWPAAALPYRSAMFRWFRVFAFAALALGLAALLA